MNTTALSEMDVKQNAPFYCTARLYLFPNLIYTTNTSKKQF